MLRLFAHCKKCQVSSDVLGIMLSAYLGIVLESCYRAISFQIVSSPVIVMVRWIVLMFGSVRKLYSTNREEKTAVLIKLNVALVKDPKKYDTLSIKVEQQSSRDFSLCDRHHHPS